MKNIQLVAQFHCPQLIRFLNSGYNWFVTEGDTYLQQISPLNFDATIVLLDPHSAGGIGGLAAVAAQCKPLFIGNLPLPGRTSHMLPPTERAEVQALNEQLQGHGYILDICGLAAEQGLGVWYDLRTWLYDIPWSASAQRVTANLINETLARYFDGRRKLLITDLDGVMWGGVAAEGNLVLANHGVGLAYQNYQRELALLKENGVLLAICSKNDPDLVHWIFSEHPEMRLTLPDFVAQEISWKPKSLGVKKILDTLGLAPAACVFIDDNLFERAEISGISPEILVPELPEDPAYLASMIRSLTCFDTLTLTDEDRRRTELYQARAARQHLAEHMDRPAFLKSLAMEVEIQPVQLDTMERFCDLSRRTTQFTTTGQHYTLESLLQRPDVEAFYIRLRDRFGDEGIVGGAVVDGHTLECLFMSCRVIGRGVEDAFYYYLMSRFYDGHRFEVPVVETPRNGPAQAWVRRIREEGALWPMWVTLKS